MHGIANLDHIVCKFHHHSNFLWVGLTFLQIVVPNNLFLQIIAYFFLQFANLM